MPGSLEKVAEIIRRIPASADRPEEDAVLEQLHARLGYELSRQLAAIYAERARTPRRRRR